MKKQITVVNGKANMIRYIKFAKIIDTVYEILGSLFAAQSKHLQIQTKFIIMIAKDQVYKTNCGYQKIFIENRIEKQVLEKRK